jgi:hypothetical protein
MLFFDCQKWSDHSAERVLLILETSQVLRGRIIFKVNKVVRRTFVFENIILCSKVVSMSIYLIIIIEIILTTKVIPHVSCLCLYHTVTL